MKTSAFQQAIESVESLSIEDQEILLDIIQKRLQQKRRTQLSQEIKEIRQEFAEGQGADENKLVILIQNCTFRQYNN